MRRNALSHICATCRSQAQRRAVLSPGSVRYVQISATPSAQQSVETGDGASSGADARFEVLGSSFSLLSASISASQNLYTRRGTLVAFNGKPENAISSLSVLGPFQRAVSGIPFLYQRVTSTTPFTALLATKSPITSLVVVHLDGRLDWMVAQRNALLAWTGHTLSLSPRLNTNMSLAHWGSTSVTGRGLLALAGKGQIHQIHLKSGEEYVVHPSNVIAYSMMQHAPQPYRFKANALRFQIPGLTTWLPDTRFWRTMRESTVWSLLRNATFTIRTWARRTIWGDRLFLHFNGPATILMQSRGAAQSDALSASDVNEIADSPAGSVQAAIAGRPADDVTPPEGSTAASSKTQPTSISYASVSSGTVKFDKETQ
ncbi:Altered inheritance of mitochondria protein 24, mitochondrial [Teratosphaeriaceae sp. CCFEE 6253]|nr:Altered inheritance of mitochondria protein 24, mitochondrial [Teratosphaeriaceae sp. CCFEE 6253]